jgi:uncharacterized protein with GYD domain
MDGYVILLRYTPTGAQHATSEAVRRRLQPVLQSAAATLRGQLVSLDVTLGAYDFVARLEIPPGQERRIMQCFNDFRRPGDFDVTVLRAFGLDDVFPAG